MYKHTQTTQTHTPHIKTPIPTPRQIQALENVTVGKTKPVFEPASAQQGVRNVCCSTRSILAEVEFTSEVKGLARRKAHNESTVG